MTPEEAIKPLLDQIEPPAMEEYFGKPIYAYTRAQAILDGLQVEVTKTAQEAGIRFPVFLTRAVWDQYVKVPAGVSCQDEAGRLWDVLWMTRFAIRKEQGDQIRVRLYVRNDRRKARLVELKAVCSALDLDDAQPAITIMLPEED